MPFTVMSCDNIPHNGHVTSDAVVGLARAGRRRNSRAGCSEHVAFPERHGRPHHAGHDRPRARHPGQGIRRRGQLAGVLRAVQAMGAGGPFHRRAPGAGKGRRAVRERCLALRADEDPHPQWRPCDDRLSGRADGHPFRARGMQEPLVRGFLDKLERDEIIPTVPPVPGVVLDEYFAESSAAFLQSDDRRHDPPALPRRLQPAAEIHHPDDRRPAEGRQGDRRPGAGIGALVPLLLRHHRFRRRHRAQRSELGALQATAKAAKGDPAAWLGMGDIYGEVGKSRRLRRGLCAASQSAVEGRHARDAAALSRPVPEQALAARPADAAAAPKLVIFDCDGVLVDSETISVAVLIEFMRKLRRRRSSARNGYRLFLGRSMAAVEKSCGRDFGLALSETASRRHQGRDLPAIPRRAEADARHRRGAVAAEHALAASRRRASPERIRLSLSLTGLLEMLEPHIYSASMVARGKPAPDLFLHAADDMGVDRRIASSWRTARPGSMRRRRRACASSPSPAASHAGSPALEAGLARLQPELIFADMARLPDLLAEVPSRMGGRAG